MALEVAIASVWRLFSAFWVMEALICSSDEVVSSTAAACSPVPCDRVCEPTATACALAVSPCDVLETCVEAVERAAAPLRTSPMTSASFSDISRMAAWRWPISSPLVTATGSRRSPAAMRRATATTPATGARKSTGNCCENHLGISPQGRLFDIGGSYVNYSDNRGQTWKSVQPIDPLVNGEGSMAVAPNGDIVAMTWDPYSGDRWESYKYNAATGEYGDMIQMGVLVPTKVERVALQNAASVASLLLTTDAVISEIKEDKPEPAGAPGGGMY